jgi:hypothetical protein
MSLKPEGAPLLLLLFDAAALALEFTFVLVLAPARPPRVTPFRRNFFNRAPARAFRGAVFML